MRRARSKFFSVSSCWSYFFLSSAGRTVIISKLRFRSASSLPWRSGLTSSSVSSGYSISVLSLFTPSALISGRSSARLKLMRLFQATCFRCRPTGFLSFSSLSIIVGALTGLVLGLPVLRLRGDYLAIVTLGFAEVVRALMNNLDKPVNFTNGPRGIAPISKPPLFFQPVLEFFGLQVPEAKLYPLYFYFLILFLVCVIIWVTRQLENSRVGRAWKAIREDEIAAAAMGVPVVRMKLLGFAVGASFAAAVGVLFAAKQVFINPESFTFMESIGVLAMVILGGMGSIPGAILGATGVTILNLQLLKGLSLWLNGLRQSGAVLSIPLLGSYSLSQLPAQFEPAKYERMVFGLILILMMIFRPQGVLPAGRERKK